MSNLTRFSPLRGGECASVASALSKGISFYQARLAALSLAAVVLASGVLFAPQSAEAQTTTPRVTLTLSPEKIDENGGVSFVTASLSAPHTREVTLTVMTELSTGARDADFVLSQNKTLTIAAGDTASTGEVTITAVDNPTAPGLVQRRVWVYARGTGGLVNPNGKNLNIVEDDFSSAGMIINPDTVTASESAGAGNTATYEVRPASNPQGTLRIELASANPAIATVSPTQLVFNRDNYRTAKTVTVTGVEDSVINPGGHRTTSINHSLKNMGIGTSYLGTVLPGISVMVTDNDAPGVSVSESEVTVAEDEGAETYTIVLDGRPTGNVTVTLTSSDKAVATVEPTTMTFNRSNWNRAQTATVTGVANTVDNPGDAKVAISHVAAGGGYDSVMIDDVDVTATDNEDTPTVTLTLAPTSISEMDGVSVVTAEMNHGSSEKVTLTVGIGGSDASGATLSQNKILTIAAGATDSTGDVRISAVNNANDEPHKAVEVSATLSSGTATLPSAPLTLTIVDDDEANMPGVTLGRIAVTVAENRGTGTYTVELDTKPTANVTITLTSDAPTVAMVSPATATFTPSNWNTPQPATVTGVDNRVDNPNNATATISHVASGGGYDSVTIDDVAVTVADNEATPMAVLRLVPLRISEDGGSATVTALLSPHGSSEAVILTVGTTGRGISLGQNRVLTIATGDTFSTGTVTILATNNDEAGNSNKRVAVWAAVSGLSGVRNPSNKRLTIVEDDFPDAGVTVSEHGVTVAETAGAGNTATYTLVLDKDPFGTVTIRPASDNETVATVSPRVLTFTSTDWQTPQTVTVTGVEDRVFNPGGGRTTFIRHALTASGGATNYNGLTVADTVVTVTDNDLPAPDQVAGVTVTAGLGQLTVGWRAVAEADGYKVQWKSGNQSYDGSRENVIGSGTTVTSVIQNLIAGTTYTVRVIATKRNAPDARPSTEATGIPTAAAPGQVTGVTVTAGVEQLTVGWAVATDADGYKVQWKSGTQSYDASRENAVNSGAPLTSVIDNLTAGTVYTVRVIATRRGAPDGQPSTEATGTARAMAPGQVTGVTVTPGEVQLIVSWTAVNSADGYKVQWKSGAQSFDPTRQAVVTTGTSHVITRLDAGTGYAVRVIAIRDHAEDGMPSMEATGTPEESTVPIVTLVLTPSSISEDGGVSTVTATLNRASASEVTVAVSAEPGSGTEAGDFMLTGATLTIAEGQTESTGTVTIATVNDSIDGPDKTVTVSGEVTAGGVEDPPDVALTITDDDESGLTIDSPSAPEGEELVFTVTLSPANAAEVTVEFVDAGTSTATSGDDYKAIMPDTLTFAAGVTEQSITVEVTDDTEIEPDETVVITLSNPSGGVALTTATGTATIANDDSTLVAKPGMSVMADLDGQTVTVNAHAEVPAGVSFTLPLTLDADVTLTVDPVDLMDQSAPSLESDQFGFGEMEEARTLVDIGVMPDAAVPTGGVEVCLPATAALREEASGRGLLLLRYAGGADGEWQALPGSREREMAVCAPGVTTFSPFAAAFRKAVPGEDLEPVLAGIARALGSDAVEVLSRRLDGGPPADAEMTLAGYVLGSGQNSGERSAAALWHGAPESARDDYRRSGLESRAISARDLLTRSSFELPLDEEAGEEGSSFGLWARGSSTGFSGSTEGVDAEGTLSSGYLGVEYLPQPSLLLGLAVAQSSGTVEHGRTDEVKAESDVSITSFMPYVHWRADSGFGMWAAIGSGSGEREVRLSEDAPARSAALTSFLVALGGQSAVGDLQGFELSVKADALSSTLNSEETAELPGADSQASRVRLLLEGNNDWRVASDSLMSLRLNLGGRWDGGSAVGGAGLEVGGGLTYSDPASGFGLEVDARSLIYHAAEEFGEWGAGLRVGLDPGTDGRGLSFSLAPSVGDARSRASEFYQRADMNSLTTDDSRQLGRVDAELAYGLGLTRAYPGTVTPYGGASWSESSSVQYRLGGRLALRSLLDLSVEGTRTERVDQPDSHGVAVKLGTNW